MLYIEGRDLARQFGCSFIESSAKGRRNVEEAFQGLVREIRKYNIEEELKSGAQSMGNGQHPGKLEGQSDESPGCCGGRCVVM